MSRLALALAVALMLVAARTAAQSPDRTRPPVPPPITKPTPSGLASGQQRIVGSVNKGERAPDFELEAAETGLRVKLSSFRGSWVVLCFAGRRDALAEIDSLTAALGDTRAQVVAVVAEKNTSWLAGWVARHPNAALHLADPTGDIARLYGIADPGMRIAETPFVLVDPKGEVRVAAIREPMPRNSAARTVQYAVTGL